MQKIVRKFSIQVAYIRISPLWDEHLENRCSASFVRTKSERCLTWKVSNKVLSRTKGIVMARTETAHEVANFVRHGLQQEERKHIIPWS